ncbi:MAG: S8 family serine peptidase [Ardenticatenaceae bacterium]|nr:S8 family serine peptidase [Ardenticatenaceae bacterium]
MNQNKRWHLLIELTAFILFLSTAAVVQPAALTLRPKSTAVSYTPATSTYLITLAAPSLVTRQAQTGPVDVTAVDTLSYRQTLRQQQAQLLAAMSTAVQRPLTARYHYTVALNALAVDLSPAEAETVAGLPGVTAVTPSQNRQPLTDAGPAWIGAPTLWDGSQTGGLPGTQGEGVVIGVIDTGINMDHPSFAAVGGDGYVHVNPLGAGHFLGKCAENPALFVCNDKLIGAYSWPETGDNPEDTWGHGSNVAGIAAGDVVTLPYFAPTLTLTPTLSGVAPHATLIAYDVCSNTTCPDYVSIKAIEQAILDGVDVLNFSIGGTAVNPWDDPLALAFLAAREAGIFVATSAGNNGPNPGTINSPGNVPWMTVAGNSTHNARFDNALVNLSGGDTAPPADLIGSSVTGGYDPAPIVRALGVTNTNGVPDNGRCAASFPANTWTQGEIVYCSAGSGSTTTKANNVLAGGAGGVVVDSGQTTVQRLGIERLLLPGLNLLSADAAVLNTWLSSGSGHTAVISGTVRAFDPAYGDELYYNSSRGPTAIVGSVLKPNVTAPGAKIWSAGRTTNPADPPELSFYIGTSQASPHVAGTAALLRVLHPDWTPAEVESALMMTAVTTVRLPGSGNPATPFDQGAGRIDLTAVARAGLLLDETAADFRAADPVLGGDASSLNLAALVNDHCAATCTWTRQFRSSQTAVANWSIAISQPLSATVLVTPTAFSIPPGGVQTITVTAQAGALPVGVWDMGELRLTAVGGSVPEAHLPLAVRRVDTNLVEKMRIPTRQNAGSQLLPGLQAAGVLTLTVNSFELVAGDVVTSQISAGETVTLTVPVSANSKRLAVEVVDSTAPDVDMVVQKTGGGGSVVCTADGPWWNESCDVVDPAPGLYEIVVTNMISGTAVDEVVVATAVVPDTPAANNWLAGPLGEAVGGDPFDLRYFWDEPAMAAGERWYGGFDLGTQPASPGDIAFIPVNLVRAADDVGRTMTSTASLLSAALTVQPNVTPVDLTYVLTETLPAGVTVTAVQIPIGSLTQTAAYLRWEVTLPHLGTETAVLTYQARTDVGVCGQNLAGALLYTTDNPGSLPITRSWNVLAGCYKVWQPVIVR